jgi:rubrerythrin
MNIKITLFALMVAAAFFTIGRITAAQEHAKLNPKTKENLLTAMHGEAFAHAKYLLFAEQARKSGNQELADLFEKTANVERMEHLREEASLAGIVGSDQDNLKDAIKGESYEVETMYPQFAKQARDVGDNAAADRFEEVRRDEMKHRDTFKAELKKLETKAVGTK